MRSSIRKTTAELSCKAYSRRNIISWIMEYRDNRSNISLLPRSVVERPNSAPVIRISSGNEFSRFSWPRRMKRVPFDPDYRHFRSTREAPILPHRVTMSRRQLAPESRNCRFYTSHFFLLFSADHSRGRSISAKATYIYSAYNIYICIFLYTGKFAKDY